MERALALSPRIAQLLDNPFFLTLMLLKLEGDDPPPTHAIEIYHEMIDRCATWQPVRSLFGEALSTTPDQRELLDGAKELLSIAAFHVHLSAPYGEVQRKDVARRAYSILQRSRASRGLTVTKIERALTELRHLSGILTDRDKLLGFSYFNLEEALAGIRLADLFCSESRAEHEESIAAIRRLMHTPDWEEPILLMAAEIGIQRRDIASATRLAEAISEEHEGDPLDAVSKRHVIMAGEILARGVPIHQSVADKLIRDLLAFMVNAPGLDPQFRAFLLLAKIRRLCGTECPVADLCHIAEYQPEWDLEPLLIVKVPEPLKNTYLDPDYNYFGKNRPEGPILFRSTPDLVEWPREPRFANVSDKERAERVAACVKTLAVDPSLDELPFLKLKDLPTASGTNFGLGVEMAPRLDIVYGTVEARKQAAKTLGEMGEDSAVPCLEATLENDSSFEVRCVAAEALGHIGSGEAIFALESKLRAGDMDKDVYFRAARALAQARGEVLWGKAYKDRPLR